MKLIPFLLLLTLFSCRNESQTQPPDLKHIKPGNLQFFETYSFSEIAPSWENACKWVHEHDSLTAEQNLGLTENPRGLNALVLPNPNEGMYMVGYVKEEDMRQVDELLTLHEVKKNFFNDLRFLWSYSAEQDNNGHKLYALYAIKMPPGNRAKIDGRYIHSANAAKSYDGRPVVHISMNTRGTYEWRLMTTNNVGKAIAIVIDDHVITCPVVNGAITGGETEISGKFTVKEAEELAARIYAGRK